MDCRVIVDADSNQFCLHSSWMKLIKQLTLSWVSWCTPLMLARERLRLVSVSLRLAGPVQASEGYREDKAL